MEKYIYNEQTGISYTLCGDYYLPDLTLSDEEKGAEIGVWGQRLTTATLPSSAASICIRLR